LFIIYYILYIILPRLLFFLQHTQPTNKRSEGQRCFSTRDKIILFYTDGFTKQMICFQDGSWFSPTELVLYLVGLLYHGEANSLRRVGIQNHTLRVLQKAKIFAKWELNQGQWGPRPSTLLVHKWCSKTFRLAADGARKPLD